MTPKAIERRRKWLAEHPALEFAYPSDIPEAGPIVTYRRGDKWAEKGRLGLEVLVMPAHGQSGPRRTMRIVELERVVGREIPPEFVATLFLVYGRIGLDELFVKITLED